MPEEPKRSRPKIVLVDLPTLVGDDLRTAGHNALDGAFGRPFTVERNTGHTPMTSPLADYRLPNYADQEIVVVDLDGPTPDSQPPLEFPMPAPGVDSLWASHRAGVVDPRPLTMAATRNLSDRILHNGGVFVFFCAPRRMREYVHSGGWISTPESSFTSTR